MNDSFGWSDILFADLGFLVEVKDENITSSIANGYHVLFRFHVAVHRADTIDFEGALRWQFHHTA